MIFLWNSCLANTSSPPAAAMACAEGDRAIRFAADASDGWYSVYEGWHIVLLRRCGVSQGSNPDHPLILPLAII